MTKKEQISAIVNGKSKLPEHIVEYICWTLIGIIFRVSEEYKELEVEYQEKEAAMEEAVEAILKENSYEWDGIW